MPILNGYSQELIYIQVNENSTNYYSYTYENLEETTFDNYLKLQLLGYNYDTIAFQLKFKNNYNKVEISYPNQSKMSGNESVIIYNSDGSIISQNYTTGGYFDFNKGTHELDLKPGYKIEIKYPVKYATKVVAYNTLLNNTVPEYYALNSTTTYTVIENGLLREDMDEEIANDIAYNQLKDYLINIIADYAKNVTENELNNKNINFDKKSYIIDAYNQLRDIDKEPFTDLINAIKRGGIPQITINTDNLEFDLGTSIDLYSLIKATDNEDGNIDIDKTSTKIITDFNAEKPGIYDIKYEVSDSDNNIATYTLQITILESEENNKDEDNGITNPPAVDDDNESDNDVVPPASNDDLFNKLFSIKNL